MYSVHAPTMTGARLAFMLSATAVLLVCSDGAPLKSTGYSVRVDVALSDTETGSFVIDVHPEWAPLGAARFKELVGTDFFKGTRFFRVVSGFMVQFGISGKPADNARWRGATISDDPVTQSNKRGMVTFATSGKDSRTTQLFINFGDNKFLDGQGFAPIGRVSRNGMSVVDRLYSGYGEGAPSGNGPDQGRIQSEGNKYLKHEFPRLSYITSATVVDRGAPEL